MKKVFTYLAFTLVFGSLIAQQWTPVNSINGRQWAGKNNAPGSGAYGHSGYSIKVFPNPAQYHFTLQLPAGKNFDVNITDISGATIYTQNSVSEEKEIDCSSFPNGVYFIFVSDGQQVLSTEKIMIRN